MPEKPGRPPLSDLEIGPKVPPAAPRIGPVFPSINATGAFHMLSESVAPKADRLEGTCYRLTLPLPPDSGDQHNPTVWLAEDGLRVIVRVLKNGRTTNWSARVSDDLQRLERPVRVRQTPYTEQIEDLRVFSRPDGLWAIAATHDGHPPAAIRQAILAMSDDGSAITRLHPLPSRRHEKNWMPCADEDGGVRFVYSTSPLIVLDMDVSFHEVRVLPRADAIPQVSSHIRGGSQLIAWQGGYLAVVHRVYRRPAVETGFNPMLSSFWAKPPAGPAVTYQHHFAFFDKYLEKVTVGAPWYFRHVGVEFCAGLLRRGDKWIASFGADDREAWLIEFDDNAIMRTFASKEATTVAAESK